MSHLWSLITSTVLDSEGEIPGEDDAGDDDVGDDVGDVTVVRDGDWFEAVGGGADALLVSGTAHEAEGVNGNVDVAGGEQEAVPTVIGTIFEPPHFL